MNESVRHELSAQQAELLGRQLATAFMNLNGYGAAHPMSVRSVDVLFESLTSALKDYGSLTVLLDRGRLYIEKHAVGKKFNPGRVISIFNDLGLESVLFEAGLAKPALLDFMMITADPETFPDVDDVSREMSRRGIGHIRLNYVVYRKVTTDQQVVAGGEGRQQAPGPAISAELSPLLEKLMGRVQEDPAEAARLITLATQLHERGVGGDENLAGAFADYIGRVSRKLLEEQLEGQPDGAGDEAAMAERLQIIQHDLIEKLSLHGINQPLAVEVERRMRQGRVSEQPQPAAKPGPTASWPDRLMSASNLRFFLDREIRLALRYKTTFSCAWITIERVATSGLATRSPGEEELQQILPEVYQLLIGLMRDVDLVGSLDAQNRTTPLIILPMTPHGNASIVRLRLEEALAAARFSLDGNPARIETTVTTLGFHPETDKDLKGYLTKLRQHHRNNQVRA